MNGMYEDGGWSVVERKARRRASKGLGKGGFGGGNAPRRLPAEVLAKFNAQDLPEAPWRAAAAARNAANKGGGKGQGGNGKGTAEGDLARSKMAWPFGPTPGPPDDELPDKPKLYCQNPNCPGFAGKRSFKFHERIGRGAGGWHCNGCGMPWERSWKMAYCGAVYGKYVPPGGSDQDEGKRCGADKDTKPKDSLLQAQGDLQQRGKSFDFTKLSSFQRLPSTFQALLQSILDLDDEGKKEAMDIFHGKAADEQDAAGDRKLAKAMVAAFTEIENKKQELLRPVVSAPPGPPSATIGTLQKARNEAVAATRRAISKVEKSQKFLLEIREQEAAAAKQHEIYLAEAE